MANEDAILAQMMANEMLCEEGKLSYEAMCVKNNALLEQLQANCRHAKTEKEDLGDGDYLIWCANDNCGVLVRKNVKDETKSQETGTVGTTRRKKGCIVVGIAIVGAASTFMWSVAEVVSSVL